MLRRVILVLIDAQNDRDILALGGGRDDDLFCPALRDVHFGLLLVGESAGGFDNDVDAQVRPWDLSGVFVAQHFKLLAVDAQAVPIGFDGAVECPQNGVILQKISMSFERNRQVVHREKFDILMAKTRTKYIAPNAPKPVDPDSN